MAQKVGGKAGGGRAWWGAFHSWEMKDENGWDRKERKASKQRQNKEIRGCMKIAVVSLPFALGVFALRQAGQVFSFSC